MTINQVAKELEVSTKTLRRWEESGFFVPEREPNTNIRLYHPYAVEYWKKLLTLNKKIEDHLKKLDPIKKVLYSHLGMKNVTPQDKLPMLDVEGYLKADKALEEWEKEYRELIKEFANFPNIMHKAVLQMEEEGK